MSTRIEARRLSGVDLGKQIDIPVAFQRRAMGGVLLEVAHRLQATEVYLNSGYARLDPRETVGIEGTKRTTTPTPKETP